MTHKINEAQSTLCPHLAMYGENRSATGVRTLSLALLLVVATRPLIVAAQDRMPPHPTHSSTWVATDALGRPLPVYPEVSAPRPNRFVGLFYYIWHGDHGTEGPFDNTLIQSLIPYEGYPSVDAYLDALDAASNADGTTYPNGYGPFANADNSGHHWGQPLFGYYRIDDEYVLRKHLQMLTDAGVDFLILDNTNAVPYTDNIMRLLAVAQDIRDSGGATPQFALLAHPNIVESDYNTIYAQGIHSDLWFYWRNKPLLLVTAELDPGTPDHIRDFFTIRTSWAISWDPSGWFGDGHHKCPWLDTYPQAYGWDTDPSQAECSSVSAGTLAAFNIGRSYTSATGQPAFGETPTEAGLFFNEQQRRVLEEDIDPELVIITQWNRASAHIWVV